jgi:acetyl-CoA carboxylase carboxyltransferase component
VTNNAQLKSVEEIRAYLQNALGEATRDTRYTLGFYEALEEIERLTDPATIFGWATRTTIRCTRRWRTSSVAAGDVFGRARISGLELNR